MKRGLVSATMLAAATLPTVSASGQDTDVRIATESLSAGDCQSALAAAERLGADRAADPRAIMLAADAYLRCGKPRRAVELYDQLIQQQPEILPRLWQRGIALYFAGEYKRAASQFVEHRKVNPHDVENAAWHFLCVVKSDSFATAQQMLLPAPNDPRVPMPEVLEMLKTGETRNVIERIEQIPADAPQRDVPRFYGNLYLGLYADARGDAARARKYLQRAAEDAPHHYMGDIARLYAKHVEPGSGEPSGEDPAGM